MGKKIASILPTASMIIIGICAMSILTFLMVIVFPNQRYAGNLDSQIKKIESEIDIQKAFFPLYREFKDILNTIKHTESIHLPFSQPPGSEPDDIYQIQSLLKSIIRQSGLTMEKIEPDVSSIVNETGFLKINLSAVGNFINFRSLLVKLNERIKGFNHIEQLRIQRVEATPHHRLAIEIWIAQG